MTYQTLKARADKIGLILRTKGGLFALFDVSTNVSIHAHCPATGTPFVLTLDEAAGMVAEMA